MKQVVRKKIAEANNITQDPLIYTALIDGNNMLKLSQVSHETSSQGLEYGAVLQFFLQMKKMLTHRDYNFVYVMWDGLNSGILRYNIYKDYKKNRDKNYEVASKKTDYDKFIDGYVANVLRHSREKKHQESEEDAFDRQKMIIQQCLEEMCIRQIECENVEGDDLIAYYIKNKKPNEKIVIYSNDRDLSQLVSQDVMIYVPSFKEYVHINNFKKKFGFTQENLVLKKILCGDASDNISGIKGLGEKSFLTYFPDAVERKLSIDEVTTKAKELLDERAKNKKKPLKVLENIINRVTDGCQGKDIYEINKKIIDLSEPMLTDEAIEEINGIMYAPLDYTHRSFDRVYQIMIENGLTKFLETDYFSKFFSPFNRIMEVEKKYAMEMENG